MTDLSHVICRNSLRLCRHLQSTKMIGMISFSMSVVVHNCNSHNHAVLQSTTCIKNADVLYAHGGLSVTAAGTCAVLLYWLDAVTGLCGL